jgi:hypothetical protein
MLRIIVTANLLALLAACSTTTLPRARCDAHLVPINQPAAEGSEDPSQATRNHSGEKP